LGISYFGNCQISDSYDSGGKKESQKKNALPHAARRSFFAEVSRDYWGWGASTGQTPAHAPQSMQVAASMTNLASPSEMAFTGHSPSHAPQLMQSSLIK
jgi:hypothetical protein